MPHDPSQLPQQPLDDAIRLAVLRDDRIACALAYGSFTKGEADAWSDLEYYLYLAPGAALDPLAFLQALTPVALAVTNEFGTPNFVTPDLVRVELHVVPEAEMAGVLAWSNDRARPDRMLIKDHGGRLRALLVTLSERRRADLDAQGALDRLLNMLTFGSAVLARGERLRALELLGWVQAGLLRLARAQTGAPQPLTVTRHAERDLPEHLRSRFARCTAALDGVEGAYREALDWAAELGEALQLDTRAPLRAALAARLHALPL